MVILSLVVSDTARTIVGDVTPRHRGALSQMLGHTLPQKLGVSEHFQWPLVGREQVQLLNLALAEGTGFHSLAPHPVKSKVHSPLPPGQPIAQQDAPGTLPTFLLRAANSFRLLPPNHPCPQRRERTEME